MKKPIFLFAFLFAVSLIAIWAGAAQSGPFTDSAGRTVEIPETVSKVLTAGPPASVLVYTLAPQKRAGWVREPRGKDKAFLLSCAGLPIKKIWQSPLPHTSPTMLWRSQIMCC